MKKCIAILLVSLMMLSSIGAAGAFASESTGAQQEQHAFESLLDQAFCCLKEKLGNLSKDFDWSWLDFSNLIPDKEDAKPLPDEELPEKASDDVVTSLPLLEEEQQQPEDVVLPEEPKEEAKPSPEEEGKQEESVMEEDHILAYEQEVVRLVNEERVARGLPALTYSAELSNGAREKSADMQKLGYFSHTSPTYGSPFDQMKARGISYRYAGENIAMGYATPEAVVDAWMHSEGHKANILSENFKEIGVGYIENGHYCTQWFKG